MLWIREPFLSGHDWPHPVTVVHGHTPEGPTVLDHRIGVDSGVFASGCLTAGELSGDRLRFITARAETSRYAMQARGRAGEVKVNQYLRTGPLTIGRANVRTSVTNAPPEI